MSKHYQRAKEIFLSVCELPPQQRQDAVSRSCGDDRELRAEVESLLSHHDTHTQPKPIPKRLEDAETAPRAAQPGGAGSEQFFVGAGTPQPNPERIGKYRILRRIGIGGMGIVYLAARDDDQFRKRVAIKVIKMGMDSAEILRRFDQERQVLSALNHPNIARMIDGGATEDGRPYFVMEYIEGQPIDEYCDKNRLRIDERLELFRTLCHALHHAHQNLIVHRDIKPSNVVVTQDGTVKLLDFGIAKLLNPDLVYFSNEPTATNFRLMTPEYASPEQVRGDPLSTASDVYSLGVLLYELVTGRRPYRFKTRLQSEIERVICNEDPERPSTAVSHAVEVSELTPPPVPGELPPPRTASTVEEIAKLREVKPDRLRRRLSGDIDNMILLAMRKEPRRRYTSAEQFAEDIRRHLDGMPVIARSTTWSYRMQKFVRRNKAGVAAAAMITLSLIIGIIATSWQASVARYERSIAVAAREKAERVQRLTSGILAEVTPRIAKMPGATEAVAAVQAEVQNFLNEFAAITGQTANDHDIARAYMQLGDVQGGLRSGNVGNVSAARTSYQSGLQLWQALAAASPDDRETQRHLANANIRVADMVRETDAERAIGMYRTAVRIGETLAKTNPNDLDALGIASTGLLSIGDVFVKQEQLEQAKVEFDQSIKIRQRLALDQPNEPKAQRELTVGLIRVANILTLNKQFDQAQPYYEQVLDIRKQLSDADPLNTQHRRDVALASYFLANNYREQHNWAMARESYEAGRKIASVLHNEGPNESRIRRDLALLLIGLADTALMERETEPTRSNAAASSQHANAANNYYSDAAALLEPIAARNRSIILILAPMLESWGRLNISLENFTNARTHLTKAVTLYNTLPDITPTLQATIKSLEGEIAKLPEAPGGE